MTRLAKLGLILSILGGTAMASQKQHPDMIFYVGLVLLVVGILALIADAGRYIDP